MAEAVERDTDSPELGEWVRFSWGSYLKAASFRGLLCFAFSAGTSVRFTSPVTWLSGSGERPEPEEAMREVTRRYLAAYAPVPAAELGRWWGGYSPKIGRRLLAALDDEAVEVDVEGERNWVLARDLEELTRNHPPRVARLLPAFDPWVAGSSRRCTALLDPAHAARFHRPQGWISATLQLDDLIAGVWKHSRKARRLQLELEPFDALPAWARGHPGRGRWRACAEARR